MSDDELLSPMSFDAGEPETVAEPEAPAEQVAPEPEQQTVPLAALKEAREENRTLKSRFTTVEAELSALKEVITRAQQPQPQPRPDLYQDPEGYARSVEFQVAARMANVEAEMSERFARQSFGDALVDEAFAAAQEKGAIDQFKGKRDAWGDLVKWHKAQKAVAEIGDDPDTWRQRERERLKAELQAELTAQSVRAPAPSLAGQANLASRPEPAWSGPTPLDEILGGKGGSF